MLDSRVRYRALGSDTGLLDAVSVLAKGAKAGGTLFFPCLNSFAMQLSFSCDILYCMVLYCTVLYCTTFVYCTVLYCIVLY